MAQTPTNAPAAPTGAPAAATPTGTAVPASPSQGTASPTVVGWGGCVDENNPNAKVTIGQPTTICLVVADGVDWSVSRTYLRLTFHLKADQYSRFHVPNCKSYTRLFSLPPSWCSSRCCCYGANLLTWNAFASLISSSLASQPSRNWWLVAVPNFPIFMRITILQCMWNLKRRRYFFLCHAANFLGVLPLHHGFVFPFPLFMILTYRSVFRTNANILIVINVSSPI